MDTNFDLRADRIEEEARSVAMAAAGGSKTALFSTKEGPIGEMQVADGGNLAGSSSTTKIKLKFSKSIEEAMYSPTKEFSHVCKECGKGFSSGKALGGHMSSAHVQAAKEKLKARRSLLDGSSDEEKHICGICLKQFRSSKSLYGHMRLHPERLYRGMEPPENPHRFLAFQNVQPPAVGDDEDNYDDDLDFSDEEGFDVEPGFEMAPAQFDLLDLVADGRRWSSTKPRGHKFGVNIFDVGDFADEEEEARVYQAARDLVMLAGGPKPHAPPRWENNSYSFAVTAESSRCEFSVKNQIPNLVMYSSSSDEVTQGNDDSEETLLVGNVSVGKGKSPMYSSNLVMDFEVGELRKKRAASLNMDFNEGGSGNLVAKKRKRVAGKAPIEGQQSLTQPLQEIYRCSTCNKTFPSHQALGGHRSSHNKVKVHVQNGTNPVNLGDQLRSSSKKMAERDGIEEIRGDSYDGLKLSMEPIGTFHGCEVCGKTFATGQALGGHKRCHYTGGNSSSSATQSPSPPDGMGGELERKVRAFDLDLNAPPPAEDVDMM